jgi:cytidyltransferase-like protein
LEIFKVLDFNNFQVVKFLENLKKTIKIEGVGAQFGAQKAIVFMKKKAIIVSGYFNPIHKGHIEYFNNAKANGDKLIVIVNSDHQRALKGSKEFQKEDERVFIVQNIKHIHQKLGNTYQLAFANGGDQNNSSIPEVPICNELGMELIDGLGDKIQSSSWLLIKS